MRSLHRRATILDLLAAVGMKRDPPSTDYVSKGIETDATLPQITTEGEPDWLVQDLIQPKSVNLFVGNSGIGKTPLLVHLGLAVATGRPWLTFQTRKGRVLYLDAETHANQFLNYLRTLKGHLGISEEVPDFGVASRNFGREPEGPPMATETYMEDKIKVFKPDLVIVDCLRPFWPAAETKSEEAAKVLGWQRTMAKKYDCAFITIHHRRKSPAGKDKPVRLIDDHDQWLQETAGSYALINQADVRIGIEPPDLMEDPDVLAFAGFSKFKGQIRPYMFGRVSDKDGYPVGYEPLIGVDNLTKPEYKTAFASLKDTFTYSEAHALMGGKSKAKTGRFMGELFNFKLARKAGPARNAPYLKLDGAMGGYRRKKRDDITEDPDSALPEAA